MNMSPRLFFLVLAAACVCRGQNQTVTPRNRTSAPPTMEESTTPMPSHQNRTSANQPDVLSTATGQTTGTQGETKTASDHVHDPDEQKPTTPAEDITVVSVIALSVTTEAASPEGSHAFWGYVLLVLLLLVIVSLLIVLYRLRRASRTYSFDLRQGVPDNHVRGSAGNFEALYLDDQGRKSPCDFSASPVANGVAPQTEEHGTVFSFMLPQEEMHVKPSKASDIGGSNMAIPAHSPKKSDPSDATEKEPNHDNMTPPDSTGLLADKDLNEPLQFNLLIASSSSSSSSSLN